MYMNSKLERKNVLVIIIFLHLLVEMRSILNVLSYSYISESLVFSEPFVQYCISAEYIRQRILADCSIPQSMQIYKYTLAASMQVNTFCLGQSSLFG